MKHAMSNMRRLSAAAAVLTLAVSLIGAPVSAQEGETVSYDGLERIESSRVAVAFKHPGADFSGFRRVAILEPFVAFRANWQRDQNRSRSRNVRSSDMDRIREDVAALFLEVFKEQLEAGGYSIVDYAAEDVLLLRPAIIDLDISAPDTRSAGRSRTYVASTGAATLFVELFDSWSNQIIGRGVDRQVANRSGGRLSWSNRVTNTADARRIFRDWADTLVAFLDEQYEQDEQVEQVEQDKQVEQ